MVSRAIARYIRMSPTKLRRVADLVRGRDVIESIGILSNLNKRACGPLGKIVKSALANALKINPSIKESQLYISKIEVGDGPTWKRYRAAAMGRGVRIRKRTSHITVEIDAKGAERG